MNIEGNGKADTISANPERRVEDFARMNEVGCA